MQIFLIAGKNWTSEYFFSYIRGKVIALVNKSVHGSLREELLINIDKQTFFYRPDQISNEFP